ncbi:SGNH/GDSL hydrolase family protein [Mucilaginibacter sp. 14171R-50]|uniref:SGNH/GDSL hydrolase family protein n=1 Tax=Mucilaginibacter sp. 14171R-50 TaxID=2703789 RepID=UPI00138BFCE0|nr:SGNH/GDSL hydrolase family protein [Mucilaginibacter sp. 14171R-50]QHS57098.1 SGNH/GDSL hydrolase family protein [Mucilaginibacter sp. 14171R-50]
MKRILFCLLLASITISCGAQTIIKFDNQNIKFMGRITLTDSAAQLTWTASSVLINFNGTSAKATLKDNTGMDRVTVVVDGKVINTTIQPAINPTEYTLVSGLPKGKHRLELFKRTEYDMGTLSFYSFNLDGKILPPPNFAHTMEFYGNSITCGYAIEDTAGKDRGTAEFENGYKSYANITARHFNAYYHSISKSGIGVVISWFNYVMPDIYDRVTANDSTKKWNFKKYTPQLVVVNLFQNDSWLATNKDHPEFKRLFGTKPPTPAYIIDHYQKFIASIRSKYPKAKIICALGAMDATKPGSAWPGYIEKAVAGLHDKAIYTHFFPYKNTPGHPSADEQQAMADDLIGFIEKTFKW